MINIFFSYKSSSSLRNRVHNFGFKCFRISSNSNISKETNILPEDWFIVDMLLKWITVTQRYDMELNKIE